MGNSVKQTLSERLRKAEAENASLREENRNLAAMQDYNVMMGNLEDPSEEEEE